MKRIILLLSAVLLTACGDSKEVKSGTERQLTVHGSTMTTKEVVLDGNTYYATRVEGGWTLCPKLPPK